VVRNELLIQQNALLCESTIRFTKFYFTATANIKMTSFWYITPSNFVKVGDVSEERTAFIIRARAKNQVAV
jgi:hypothetical protein